MNGKYNCNDINSIVNYSKELIGKTFLDVINESLKNTKEKKNAITKYGSKKYKGGLGILLEELYFGYKSNNNQSADFNSVGLELKSTPYEIKIDGSIRAGERLSITMVPHNRPIESDFYNSDVWHKIEKLLLIFYKRDKKLNSRLEYRIDYSYLFRPPLKDLSIIISDYKTIVDKVIAGKAHELSESDTLYLGACTKGSTASKSIQPQFYGNHIPAKARNFCFKQPYMTYILNKYIVPNSKKIEYESILPDNEQLLNKTFEKYIEEKIQQYVGKSDCELCNIFNREYNNNKSQWVDLAYRILGIKSNKAEEFEKANIKVKSIRIEQDNSINENMSFSTFKFKKLILEEWESSELFNYFSETRFLFVVYTFNGSNYILKGCQFWNMPLNHLNTVVKESWEQVVRCIKYGVKLTVHTQKNGKKIVKNNLLKESDNRIIHVRPKAQKSYYLFLDGTTVGSGKKSDTNELPDGTLMTTQCFWLNKDYVLSQIKEELKNNE